MMASVELLLTDKDLYMLSAIIRAGVNAQVALVDNPEVRSVAGYVTMKLFEAVEQMKLDTGGLATNGHE